jgi:hypothetical protein
VPLVKSRLKSWVAFAAGAMSESRGSLGRRAGPSRLLISWGIFDFGFQNEQLQSLRKFHL